MFLIRFFTFIKKDTVVDYKKLLYMVFVRFLIGFYLPQI